jgi:hypothetical protein
MRPNTEVLMVSTRARQSGMTPRLSGTQHRPDNGVQEITFYYAGYFASNAVSERFVFNGVEIIDKQETQHTAQLHSRDYTMRLLPIEEALANLNSAARIREESRVLASALQLYEETERWMAFKRGV